MPANPNCFVITCIGARDGVGKTVFATNIALSFQRETRRRVCLVDLDALSCGDVSSLLKMPPAKTIAELAPIVERAQPQLLKGAITAHPSGIHVLPLYRETKELAGIPGDAIGK